MRNRAGTVVSGIQPTAGMHLGNYFGAIQGWLPLQDTHNCFFFVADLHALTMPIAPEALTSQTETLVVELLACGLDPNKVTLFIQSLVPEHAELHWLLSCVTPFGDLSRMTQFKDKSRQVGEADSVNLGLFSYPTLQAADILIYRASHVPVGRDQEQHLELSRTLARRFNERFSEIFPLPQPLFTPTPRIASPADPTRKMSKSLGPKHYIGLFEDEASIRQKIRSAVVDSGDLPADAPLSPGLANLLELLRASGDEAAAEAFLADYQAGRRQYAELKGHVADALVRLTTGLRARRDEVLKDRARALRQVADMSEHARDIARDTLRNIRRAMGLPARDAGGAFASSGWLATRQAG